MHAAFWESEALDKAPIPDVTGPLRVCAEPLLHVAGRRESADGWVHAFLDDFKVMTAFAPIFFEVLGPRLTDQYLDLVADQEWRKRLRSLPPTLLQGDPRRANISFADDRAYLFDWEFAAKGPPGCDLQGHCFLHYWSYPPPGVEPGADCEDLLREYAVDLKDALGREPDWQTLLEGWQLGWLKMISSIGFLLIDPLFPDGGTAEDRSKAKSLSVRAVQRALDIRSALP